MKARRGLFVGVLLLLAVLATSAETVTITYWQYYYESKVNLVDELIKKFEALNPGIKVEQVTFPYESFNQKVAASIPAGEGPDVITLFYGWLPMYVKGGYLQELPKSDFNKAWFDKTYYPFVAESVDFGGKYYSAPTAVRTLALIWNKALFREAGLDPNVPPKTLEELSSFAKKLSKYDAKGNLVQAGLLMQPSGQGHAWLREVLFRQFGNSPYDKNYTKVTYTDEKAVAAFKWYTDLITKDRVGYPNFATDDVTAFMAGKGAMNIDGSFRIATLNGVKGLDWGVAELPSYKGIKSNYASYWTHGIVSGTSGKKLEASIKFLKFLVSPEVQELWLQRVGELPATPALSEKYKNDPVIQPFLKGLEYAKATLFVDEAAQRKVLVDAVDEVVLNKADPANVLKSAAVKEQAIIDNFWK